MFAETGAGGKQKLIDRVGAEQRWCRGVVKILFAEDRQHCLDVGVVVTCLFAQLCGHRGGARVATRGQRKSAPSIDGRQFVVVAPVRIRDHVVAGATANRFRIQQLKVTGEARRLRGCRWQIECEQPAPAVRFDGDGVVDHRPQAFDHARRATAKARGGPAVAVEIPHHRAAPIELIGPRDLGAKTCAQGDCIRGQQFADAARRHFIRQASGAGEGVLRHAPERPRNARKQHKQYQHQGQRLHQQHAGAAELVAIAGLLLPELKADQGCGDDPHYDQQIGCHCDRLRIQKIGDDHKIAEEDENHGVAQRHHFKEFEDQHHHQQGDAGIAP